MRIFTVLRFQTAVVCTAFFCLSISYAFDNPSNISFKKGKNNFALSYSGKSAPLFVSSQDYPGVIRAFKDLQADIEKVTGTRPELTVVKSKTSIVPASREIVLAGTIGKSPLIDQLIKRKKLNVKGVSKKWETFLIQVVEKPFPNISRALVIAGSDKRGAIFGIYDVCKNIGVSPLHWWADVPAKKNSSLFVLPGRYVQGEHKVKYRGIFINDEAPALSGFVYEKFGGYTSAFYVHVFELLLRLKSNFLWPAMWNNSFGTDDSLNSKLADEYGIVMSTSHHEPMMRAFVEWTWAGNKRGSWDYSINAPALRDFWREGIRRNKNFETITTLAMRGDGDEPMSEESNIDLLQQIVGDQRKIIEEVTGKKASDVPQVWAVYKEVQDYYDKGMRVPDDVTILLCDDNWGNIRKLPRLTDPLRSGRYGIYYHFDFVGGPRSYRWLNTTQIERVWEQMNLAYSYGADRIWIVNVGDIKPMEFPISFFLDYAWDPKRISASDLPEYTRKWAEDQFGAEYSKQIAEILNSYTKFNSRRKPEMLSPDTYSLVNYREAETVVEQYYDIVNEAQQISNSLPAEYKDTFYQLVLHQSSACANLNDLYVTVGKNRLYAKQGRSAANTLARKAKELFLKDSLITMYYNNILSGGKWKHMMDQTHIGYISWQEPRYNKMPEVSEISIPEKAEMGVAIEGTEAWWPDEKNEAVLPEYDVYNQQKYYIEIFNRGKVPYEYSINADRSWILVSFDKGVIETEKRLWVSIDWRKAPKGTNRAVLTINGPDSTRINVQAVINNPHSPKRSEIRGFVESNGYISINAENYSAARKSKTVNWVEIPNLGRTASAMIVTPVTAQPQVPEGNSPRLEYQIYLFSEGEINVKAYLSPTLNFHKTQGLRYALSIDDEQPQIVNMHENAVEPDWLYPDWWNQAVSDNTIIKESKHQILKKGAHVLKFWMVDPGVVLQKIVVETGDVKPSYLGPPESFRQKNN
ncbi:MAG: glycosyl hydrolase 115 family protein [Bacteroidetes bacterium]|nr:glycosyl hydrolase 115 family protein [Bacteroidota bacterium]